MDISGLPAAIFFGNMLTAAFIWGLIQASKHPDPRDWHAGVFFALLVPLVFGVMSLLATGYLPPQFDALGFR